RCRLVHAGRLVLAGWCWPVGAGRLVLVGARSSATVRATGAAGRLTGGRYPRRVGAPRWRAGSGRSGTAVGSRSLDVVLEHGVKELVTGDAVVLSLQPARPATRGLALGIDLTLQLGLLLLIRAPLRPVLAELSESMTT